jgi:hypothetical protein
MPDFYLQIIFYILVFVTLDSFSANRIDEVTHEIPNPASQSPDKLLVFGPGTYNVTCLIEDGMNGVIRTPVAMYPSATDFTDLKVAEVFFFNHLSYL